MKLHFLGTCAGTEPMPGRHHTAWILETNDTLYQFDAGESSSYTAYAVMKLDLLKMRAIFISHPHIDHVGGLPNLYFTIPKLVSVYKNPTKFDQIDVLLPDERMWYFVTGLDSEILNRRSYSHLVNYRVSEVSDGVVYSDENIKVEALHNLHLGVPENGKWKSYSYKITCEGKTVVFSGDIKSLDDIKPFLQDHCDLLLLETGHHHPEVIAAEVKKYPVDTIGYIHCGRDNINNYDGSAKAVKEVFGDNFFITEDATTREL